MKLLVCGDYCPQGRVALLQDSIHQKELMNNVTQYIALYDHAIVNLECPLLDGHVDKISKAGPNLSAAPTTAKVLAEAGFDIVTLANNHILDYGQNGVLSTINCLNKNGLKFVGLRNEKVGLKSHLLLDDNSGNSVCIINVCETEFNIASPFSYGAVPIDIINIKNVIDEIRTSVHYCVAIIHGGHEHYQLPSPRMKRLYHFLIDLGIDVIINHHQHCYSGYELYNGKPIFYGLGNFCFDNAKKRNQKWNYGYMVGLDFTDTSIDYKLYPYNQCSDEPIIKELSELEKIDLDQKLKNLNVIISNDEKLNEEYEKFLLQNERRYMSYFSPYGNRYLRYLCRKGFIPCFLNRNRKDVILDMIRCDSHREVVEQILSMDYENRNLEKN